jgi:hypothetical protein
VKTVRVKIARADGTMVEQGEAVQGQLYWEYSCTVNNASFSGCIITVIAYDLPGNPLLNKNHSDYDSMSTLRAPVITGACCFSYLVTLWITINTDTLLNMRLSTLHLFLLLNAGVYQNVVARKAGSARFPTGSVKNILLIN